MALEEEGEVTCTCSVHRPQGGDGGECHDELCLRVTDQQEAHGCKGNHEATSVSGLDRPAAGTWYGKGL